MTLNDKKSLAEKFRALKDDSAGRKKLATDTKAANTGDTAVAALCDGFATADDGTAVSNLADEVKARTA